MTGKEKCYTMMRYHKLFDPKYFEAFSHYDSHKDTDILKEFGQKLSEYHLLLMMAELDWSGKHFPEKTDEMCKMWPSQTSLAEIIQSMKRKSKDGSIFTTDPQLLTSDEVFILLEYPFLNRIGDSYEEDFASSGDLYKWLCLLKEKVEMETEEKRLKSCCFTGHRPHLFPWGEDMTDPRAKSLIKLLSEAIEETVQNGYTEFICGGALGVDTWAAGLVLQAKERHPHIRLTLALPWKDHNSHVADPDFLRVKQLADETIVVSDKQGKEAFLERDQWMVDHSNRIIAVYDDRSGLKGGTYYTLQYARSRNIEIKQIEWMSL